MPEHYPSPESKEHRSIGDILAEFGNRTLEFVDNKKIAIALGILATLGASCAKNTEVGNPSIPLPVPTPTYQTENPRDDTYSPQGVKLGRETDNRKIDTLRKQIKQNKPSKETVKGLKISEAEARDACGQVIKGQFTLTAINVLNSKKVACAFVEKPAEGASENEEQQTFEALLFRVNESGAMSLIAEFAADSFDAPRKAMENNSDLAKSRLTLDELTWLVQHTPESDDLVTIK